VGVLPYDVDSVAPLQALPAVLDLTQGEHIRTLQSHIHQIAKPSHLNAYFFIFMAGSADKMFSIWFHVSVRDKYVKLTVARESFVKELRGKIPKVF